MGGGERWSDLARFLNLFFSHRLTKLIKFITKLMSSKITILPNLNGYRSFDEKILRVEADLFDHDIGSQVSVYTANMSTKDYCVITK